MARSSRPAGPAHGRAGLAPSIVSRFELPDAPRHGYGLRLRVVADGSVAEATSAVEALDGWWESPRHAAITDYREASTVAASAVARPGQPGMSTSSSTTTGCGATIATAHPTARSSSSIRWARRSHTMLSAPRSMRVTRPASPRWPTARSTAQRPSTSRSIPLNGSSTRPASLSASAASSTSTTCDPARPGAARLLGEYVDAIEHFGFDGIHMDTYGPPHSAVAADGEPIDFAALYPGLIEEAAALVVLDDHSGARACCSTASMASLLSRSRRRRRLRSTSSCGRPTARSPTSSRWVDHARGARRRAAGRHRRLRRDAEGRGRRRRPCSRVRGDAAAGLGHRRGGCLSPHAGRERPAAGGGLLPRSRAHVTRRGSIELQALWRFTARYVHLLSDPGLDAVEPIGLDIRDAAGRPVPWATEPEAGSIWARVTQLGDDGRVLHLLDLRAQPDAWWDAPKQPPADAEGLRLTWTGAGTAVAASPWTHDGPATGGCRRPGAAEVPALADGGGALASGSGAIIHTVTCRPSLLRPARGPVRAGCFATQRSDAAPRRGHRRYNSYNE